MHPKCGVSVRSGCDPIVSVRFEYDPTSCVLPDVLPHRHVLLDVLPRWIEVMNFMLCLQIVRTCNQMCADVQATMRHRLKDTG